MQAKEHISRSAKGCTACLLSISVEAPVITAPILGVQRPFGDWLAGRPVHGGFIVSRCLTAKYGHVSTPDPCPCPCCVRLFPANTSSCDSKRIEENRNRTMAGNSDSHESAFKHTKASSPALAGLQPCHDSNVKCSPTHLTGRLPFSDLEHYACQKKKTKKLSSTCISH